MSLNYGLKHNNIFFFQKECIQMNKEKVISFRLSKQEYEQLLQDKPSNISLSDYIRELIL